MIISVWLFLSVRLFLVGAASAAHVRGHGNTNASIDCEIGKIYQFMRVVVKM